MNVLHRNCKTDIKEFLHVIVTQLLAPDLKEKVQKVCKYYAHKPRKAFFPETCNAFISEKSKLVYQKNQTWVFGRKLMSARWKTNEQK